MLGGEMEPSWPRNRIKNGSYAKVPKSLKVLIYQIDFKKIKFREHMFNAGTVQKNLKKRIQNRSHLATDLL